MDKRLRLQFVTLGVLTALPIVMIGINGSRAVYAILTPVRVEQPIDNSGDVEPSKPEALAPLEPVRFGVYDSEGEFAGDQQLSLRHVYVSWADYDRDQLSEKLQAIEQQGFEALLTIEPWPIDEVERPVLEGIVAGEYDQVLDEIATIIHELNGPVYVSWGHEMDQDLTERYPWSACEPERFTSAYRYVVDRIRAKADTPIYWVWAGVLKEGSLKYWPGDKYVDFIGMPIYSFPAFDQKAYGYIRDFRTTFEEKRDIVADIDKPLMITELGVSGDSDFENFWLHQAFMCLGDYPDIVGVVFFFASDTEGAWGKDLETPDWRVHPDAIRGLVDWHLATATKPKPAKQSSLEKQ